MITVNEAPVKQPMFIDEAKTQLHPVWAMFFNQLSRAARAVTNSSESVLASNFNITGADGVYQDTGLSITLPSAGTYFIYGNIRAALLFSVGSYGYIKGKLYNSTDSADVANSERMIGYEGEANIPFYNSAPLSMSISVSAAKTIKLYVARAYATTWTTSMIYSDSNGRTNLGYIQLSSG